MQPSRRALMIATPAVVVAGFVGSVLIDRAGPAPAPDAAGPAGPPAGPPGTGPPGKGAPATAALPSAPTSGPAVVVRTTFASAARGRQVSMVVIRPAGSRRDLPVCVVLHGRGDDAERSITLLGLDVSLAAAARAGVPAFALVAVDGGETYWHRRASGDDPERMILDEVRPRLTGLGLRTARLAAMGWSMGGYGALLLARRHPDLVVAAAASSPAMWRTAGATAPGAFDSPADFTAHQVLGTAPAPGVTYRIDCGDSDPFSAVSRQAVRDLRAQEHSFGAGGHTPDYWRRVAPAQLAFIGAALHRAS
jgi:S-formylglutathione hydrolase FrmB